MKPAEQTDVKRMYWDDELHTIVYELVNGRKMALTVFSDSLGDSDEFVTDVGFTHVL